MTREDIQKGISELDINKKVSDRIKRAGLGVPQRPLETLEGVSIDSEWDNMKKRYGGISNMPYNEIGEFLSKWAETISYTRWCEAAADIESQTAREIKDRVENQLYTLQDGGRELRSASVTTEPLYIKCANEYLEKSTLYTAIKGLREAYEARLNAVSRELTRRTTDIDTTRRNLNINGGGR